MGLCHCFDCFKPSQLPSLKSAEQGDEDSEEDSSSDEVTPTAVSKPRERRISQYHKFFQGHNVNELAFTQRLSTITNDRLINFIELPLRINLNEGTAEPSSWVTFRTPAEFFTSMGYRKLKELGQGGFGTVFLVEKCVPLTTTGGKRPKSAKAVDDHFAYYQMACKVIMLPDDEDRSSRRQFESLKAELYMLQGLRGKCAYVIEYYEHFVLRFKKAGSRINYMMAHIFMEVADAGSMVKEVEKKGPLSTDLARRYFAEMSSGLEFLHRNRISHNDFKLDNVLLVSDPKKRKLKHCKLTDFGMSAFAWKDGVGLLYSKHFMGTRSYMAPLVQDKNSKTKSRQEDYVPFSADIWSLGVSLYVMLTRKFPYQAPRNVEKLSAFLAQISKGVLTAKEAKQKFGTKLANLMCGMLEFDPSKRFTIATVKSHEWLKTKARKT
ncbi:PREDICTED: serine/threonine-protein kinase SAPK3-like [Rhagoletis zephyria]|uniref:serine/threonine-protein kinase SAPK3-like n=1 Tax=Rhagoletis zephyria TaxID=28612 RepID=UPI00081184FB|nr:PREDICTED: serine/threonine-protein kinase SAPK3-like [Rhagoletis zephyria]